MKLVEILSTKEIDVIGDKAEEICSFLLEKFTEERLGPTLFTTSLLLFAASLKQASPEGKEKIIESFVTSVRVILKEQTKEGAE